MIFAEHEASQQLQYNRYTYNRSYLISKYLLLSFKVANTFRDCWEALMEECMWSATYTEGTQQIVDVLTTAGYFSLEMLIRLLCTPDNSYSQAPCHPMNMISKSVQRKSILPIINYQDSMLLTYILYLHRLNFKMNSLNSFINIAAFIILLH